MRTTHFQTAGRRLLLAASLVALVLIPVGAGATPGALDPGFGQGGIVTTAIGSGHEGAYAVALQADGKLVAAGDSRNGSDYDFALVRYNRNGTLDPSFGTGGKVTTAFGSSHDSAGAIAVRPDGKLVVAGYSAHGSTSDFALARYNPNGTLDPSFGTGGKVTIALGTGAEDGATALVLQPDGKLVAAGGVQSGSRSFFALARFNANGTLDASFGVGGKVTTGIGSASHAGANTLALQPDGKLVAAGSASNGGYGDVALARYNANGTLDSSFGSGGVVVTVFGSGYDSASALAIRPGGKLVIAGQSWNGSHYDLALARYSSNGTLDPSFGAGGKVTTAIGSGDALAEALAVEPDGKLVVAGASSDIGFMQHFAVARFTPNGTLDPTFGSGGKSMTPVGPDFDGANALAIQRDGKLVAAGATYDGSDSNFAVVRYLGTPPKVVCVVPKLKGKTLRAAKRALTKAHCSTGRLTRSFSAKVRKGRVIVSKPRPGKTLAQGGKVRLQVSKGKK